MIKKIGKIIVIASLIITIVPTGSWAEASAASGSYGTINSYDTAQIAAALSFSEPAASATAVKKISSSSALRSSLTSKRGGTYKLTKDIKGLTGSIKVSGGTYTLDLNGHTISGKNKSVSLILVSGGKLTIKDSSTEGKGAIKNTNNQDAVGCSGGTLIINGGNFSGNEYAVYTEKKAKVTINGGTFTGKVRGICVSGGTVNIKGGMFKATDDFGYAIHLKNPASTTKLTISGGTAKGGHALGVTGNDKSTVLVKGGNFNGVYEGIGMVGGKLTVENGTFTASKGDGLMISSLIYSSEVKVTGGDFTGNYAAVSMQNNADVNITGGTFNGEVYDLLAYKTFVGEKSFDKSLFRNISDESASGLGVTETSFKRVDITYVPGMKISDANSLYSLIMYACENLQSKISFVTDEHLHNVLSIYEYQWTEDKFRDTSSSINIDSDGTYHITIDTTFQLEYQVEVLLDKPSMSSKASAEANKYSQKIKKILSGIIKDGMTRKQKVKAVNNYMVKKYSYDYDFAASSFQFYGPLDTGKAVCQGYATLFRLFMLAEGVPCECVSGAASSGPGKTDYELHMWNRIKTNGEWLYVDVTFNDGIGSNSFLLLKEKAFYGKGYHC